MRPIYETAKDRKIEQAIINELSDAWKIFYQKLPIKHRLDFALLDDRRNVTSWAEVKRRDNDSTTYDTTHQPPILLLSFSILSHMSR